MCLAASKRDSAESVVRNRAKPPARDHSSRPSGVRLLRLPGSVDTVTATNEKAASPKKSGQPSHVPWPNRRRPARTKTPTVATHPSMVPSTPTPEGFRYSPD